MKDLWSWLERVAPGPEQLIVTLFTIVVGLLAATLATRLLERAFRQLRRQVPVPRATEIVLQRSIRTLIGIFVLAVLLSYLGVSLGGLWTALVGLIAATGIGLLAVWALASNITAALFIAIWKPYRLGEDVEILPDRVKGCAIDRNLMFTLIREDDGAVLAVPNSMIFQRFIRSWPVGRQQALPEPRPRFDENDPRRPAP